MDGFFLMKQNLSSHGGRIPNPHTLNRDSESTVSFSLLVNMSKTGASSMVSLTQQPNLIHLKQWQILIKKNGNCISVIIVGFYYALMDP